MVTALTTDVRAVVASVVDPEIPVLTIDDLGILRSVETEGSLVIVTITPTYSGCPAMRQIEDDISSALTRHGVESFEVRVTHSPAWSTDWISEEGHRKLAEFGIAPPTGESEVLCPRCHAGQPRMVARFGSTACKALMVCSSCGEPFDYFKQY
ncbi:MAG TPA: 1,2-phenylacetyl-CoA epoxidase subunit PaaD [Acidimicrobiia bacterium]|nr:1,2-phenylacetyl-CoA epoxidase subunit PaaD [Acidimicrobiia bacterium]